MKHVFYLIAILFAIYELLWVLNPIEYAQKALKRKEAFKRVKGLKFDDWSEKDRDALLIHIIWSLFIIIWMFCGLLTFNWPLFAAYLFFGFLIFNPIDKIVKHYIGLYTLYHFLHSLMGLAFAIFIILNSYHLKIDFWQLIMNYFNAL